MEAESGIESNYVGIFYGESLIKEDNTNPQDFISIYLPFILARVDSYKVLN